MAKAKAVFEEDDDEENDLELEKNFPFLDMDEAEDLEERYAAREKDANKDDTSDSKGDASDSKEDSESSNGFTFPGSSPSKSLATLAAKRAECESIGRGDVECTVSAIAMDNCVLRCISSRCYNAVYGDDALEEGEIDVQRGRTFRSCARTELRDAKQRETEEQRRASEREERADNL